MNSNDRHSLCVLDFVNTNYNTTFVKFSGFDAVLEREFEGEVKFVGGRPYGDIVHPDRSSLSPECIEFVQTLLLKMYEAGEFNE